MKEEDSMKRISIIAAILLIVAAGVPAQEELAADAPPVQATGGNTVGLMADVSQPSAVAQHFRQHWWKYLGIAAAGYAADRVAENNDWWWHEDKSPTPRSVGGDVHQSQATTETENINVTVSGNGGDVAIEINYKTVGE
jgi:hypothetical protein